MRKIAIAFMAIMALGCAKVNLQTSRPLKVDINMRVDIYQHVVKDAASIEDQVYGTKEKRLNAIFSAENAYAEDFSTELTPAIERRKERMPKIEDYFIKGYIGENKDALLEIRDESLAAELKSEIESLIQTENRDRDIIYQATAQKNSAELSQVKKAFFEDHHKRAASGYWFQVFDENQGKYIWLKK